MPILRSTRIRALSIDYESEHFPPGRNLAVSGTLAISWGDILWAALTLGRPNLNFVFRHGQGSRYEALFRLSLVRMALEQRPTGSRLRRTNAFKALDPTEKGAVNYFLGMTFCKLFADRLLNTPWLLHLDVFRQQLTPATLGGRSRPDLVGQEVNGGAWHVFESKGRASKPGSREKTKAKSQAQRLVRLSNRACDLHIGAITYFSSDTLRFYWRDPDPEKPDELPSLDLDVPEGAWRNYYAAVVALIRTRTSSRVEGSDGRMQLAEIEEADVSLGAHSKILPLLLAERWEEARRVAIDLGPELQNEGYRSDGLIVRAGESWLRPLNERVRG